MTDREMTSGQGSTTIDLSEAIAALQKHYEQCCDMLTGLDWTSWTTGTPAERATLPQITQEHILELDDGKNRWLAHVGNLSKAYALCPVSDYALQIREDVAFFQIVATMFRKYSPSGRSASELDLAVRQLISKAVVTAQGEVTSWFCVCARFLRRTWICRTEDGWVACRVSRCCHDRTSAPAIRVHGHSVIWAVGRDE